MKKQIELSDHPKSCMNKALDDELVFILLARDPFAPQVIMEWVKVNYNIQPMEKLIDAIEMARDMGAQLTSEEFRMRVKASKEGKAS